MSLGLGRRIEVVLFLWTGLVYSWSDLLLPNDGWFWSGRPLLLLLRIDQR